MTEKQVVIVGGGIIGTACAHYLTDQGFAVTVVDKGRHGGGCSHANCGLISPSHVLPLNEPGAVSNSLKYLLWKNPPLRISPRLDPALWTWLMNFAARCTPAKMMEGARALSALLESTVACYAELRENPDFQCEWQDRGCLFVYRTPRAFDAFGEENDMLSREFGVSAVAYTGSALQELEPALRPDVAGGWHYEMDAFVRPDKVLSTWRQWLCSVA